jgi:hypothetical protein
MTFDLPIILWSLLGVIAFGSGFLTGEWQAFNARAKSAIRKHKPLSFEDPGEGAAYER